ncbi:MAG: hypothetical protein ACE5HE_06845 [Phycisphaerae bacterium]
MPAATGNVHRFHYATLALCGLGCACVPVGGPAGALAPRPSNEADVGAVATVVAAAYADLEHPGEVFLAAANVRDATMTQARLTLEASLHAVFLDISDDTTGPRQPMIVLGPFICEHERSMSVSVNVVDQSGGPTTCVVYHLARSGGGWQIVDVVDTWPNCPLGVYGEETHSAAIDRAQGEACFGLWTGDGTCGPWLYVVETSGFSGTVSYYDPNTELLVARQAFTDTADQLGPYFFDCEPHITETIPCTRHDPS